MEIVFRTITRDNQYEPRDSHEILADGVKMMSAHEGLEPEDVLFCRDLHSPFECKKLIELVIEKTKAGEEITFKSETVQ